ncbi:patatin family protein [Vibrio kasasachensis]|uniref:patatin-like phospholipase family protein n=1 Tax=Vibrio kasasachensis TaxID=2910248 RepID=UPI003D124096
MTNKALVVEGGAMRGIFASGVLDAFLDQQYKPFDFAVGVSAGASNLLGYLSNAPGRSYKVITEIATDKLFFNRTRFARGGDLVDVKWLIDESNRRFPLDKKALFATPMIAAVTNIETGNADYFQLCACNLDSVLEATTALPIAYKSTPCFSGGCYTDGGVADSIPVKEAYRRGARDITVVLSQPLSYQMRPTRAPWLMKKLLARYPSIAESMLVRADNYNQSLEFIRHPPNDATIRVIAPPDEFHVKRLTMNKAVLEQGYQMGLEAGWQHLVNRNGTHGLDDQNCHFCL